MDERSDRLREIILQKYPSIRAFAREADIPHGTLVSALNHGIDGMAWGKLARICSVLDIDAATLEPVCHEEREGSRTEKRLLAYYNALNSLGRAKVDEYVMDISRIAAYKEEEVKKHSESDGRKDGADASRNIEEE